MAQSNSKQTLFIKSGYILVERPLDYEVVLSDQPAQLLEISKLCEQAECRKVLVTGQRTVVRLSTAEIFSLGEQIAQLGLLIAFVEHHDATRTDVEFLENVSANRGGPIQFFETVQEAKAWLRVD